MGVFLYRRRLADTDGERPSVDCEAVGLDGLSALIWRDRPWTLEDGVTAAISNGVNATAGDLFCDGCSALVADERRGCSDLCNLDFLNRRFGKVRVWILAEARFSQVNRSRCGQPGVAIEDCESR